MLHIQGKTNREKAAEGNSSSINNQLLNTYISTAVGRAQPSRHSETERRPIVVVYVATNIYICGEIRTAIKLNSICSSVVTFRIFHLIH